MSDEFKDQAQKILAAVLPLDAGTREQFLDELGVVSPGLRSEVEAMIVAEQTIDSGDKIANEANPNDVATLGADADSSVEKSDPDDPTHQFSLQAGDDKQPGSVNSKSALPSLLGEAGTLFGSDYEIVKVIGRGGMGTVFKAYQRSLKRHVALKTISHQNLRSPADVARFQVEAEAAGQLDHPGIVPVYDIGESDGCHYYAMAYIEGISLSDLLKRGKQRIKPRNAAELMEKLCRALQYAHDRAVIHRDIKPSNIMLDSDGNPRLTDFGLAKLQKGDDNLTMTGQVLGTPSYMAPEQAAGKQHDISNRTDVYSLGATLYALLSGRPPFKGETIVDTLRQVVSAEPPALDMAGGIHGDLQTICSKCMAKLPADRYASAAEVADDLQRYLDGFPIAARPLGLSARLVRWGRRNPQVAALLGVVAISLVAGTIVSLAFAVKASRQKTIALHALAEARSHGEQLSNAIEDFFVVVSEDTLMNQPGMQALRERLLRKAIEHYQQITKQTTGIAINSNRPAHALIMIGKLEAADERFDDAGKSFRRAERIFQEITSSNPTRIEPLATLANVHNELAKISHKQFSRQTKLRPFDELAGQDIEVATLSLDNWLRHAQETVKLRTEVANFRSDSLESIRLLANATMNHGIALAASASARGESKETNQARALMSKAQDIRLSARQEYPKEMPLVRDLGIGFHNLGRLEMQVAERELDNEKRSERQVRANEEFTKAIHDFELFLETNNELETRYRLVKNYREKADLQLDRQQLELAEVDYAKALSLANRLSGSNPRVYTYRVMLADIQYNYCQLLFMRNQAVQAFAMLDRCQKTLVAALRLYPGNSDPGTSTDSNRAAEDYTRFVSDIAQRIAGINQFEAAIQRLQLAMDELQELVDESAEFSGLKRYIKRLQAKQDSIRQLADERSKSA